MTEWNIYPKPFQENFLKSEQRYPALIAGIGTGKTMFMLLKIWKYCEEYPNSLALVVRKEYTDLKDSTMRDFQDYFGVTIGANKDYVMPNKSTIMFRHGDELGQAVLKNINLSIFGIEQAEEFETEESFTFLRDRLRRQGAPYRQGIVIANAHGHNWLWKMWVNNPAKEFDCFQANTFDNESNLPKDFIEDLTRMKAESPHHYNRFVMNSHEDMDDADILIPYQLLEESVNKNYYPEGAKILSVDVARFGDDDTVFSILQKASVGWKQVYLFGFHGQDTVKTFGHIIDLRREYHTDYIVIDDDGVGGGVTDNLHAANEPRVFGFKANEATLNPEEFYRQRDECYWTLKKLFDRGQIEIINNEKLMTQLSSVKFYYTNKGVKKIWSKDEMKSEGLKSPDYADALMMSMKVLHHAEKHDKEAPYENYAARPGQVPMSFRARR